MKKVQPEEGESADLVSENIERLKELFPDAFSEGGINIDVLRQLLGDAIRIGRRRRKIRPQLAWQEERLARLLSHLQRERSCLAQKKVLIGIQQKISILSKGDNLEVLKLLQKSYANKVKMIYIDPPYNTGKEFIYPDKFSRYSGHIS